MQVFDVAGGGRVPPWSGERNGLSGDTESRDTVEAEPKVGDDGNDEMCRFKSWDAIFCYRCGIAKHITNKNDVSEDRPQKVPSFH